MIICIMIKLIIGKDQKHEHRFRIEFSPRPQIGSPQQTVIQLFTDFNYLSHRIVFRYLNFQIQRQNHLISVLCIIVQYTCFRYDFSAIKLYHESSSRATLSGYPVVFLTALTRQPLFCFDIFTCPAFRSEDRRRPSPAGRRRRTKRSPRPAPPGCRPRARPSARSGPP